MEVWRRLALRASRGRKHQGDHCQAGRTAVSTRVRKGAFDRIADPEPAIVSWMKILCNGRSNDIQRAQVFAALRTVIANWDLDEDFQQLLRDLDLVGKKRGVDERRRL